MLDYGACDRELVCRGAVGGSGLRYEGLENGVLEDLVRSKAFQSECLCLCISLFVQAREGKPERLELTMILVFQELVRECS